MMQKNKLKSFSIDDIALVETEHSDKYFEIGRASCRERV